MSDAVTSVTGENFDQVVIKSENGFNKSVRPSVGWQC